MVKQKIQWRTHFIELIVVIIGITIAFSLNNWAQGRKDRRSEQEYLRSFLEDLDQDIAQLDSLISNSKKQMSSAGELFRILGQDDPLASIRHHHITSYYIVDYFHPKTGSFNSIVNSGNFDLIQNFVIRSEMSDLYNVTYENVSASDAFIRNLVDNNIYPYVLHHVKFSRTGISDLKPIRSTPFINLTGSFVNTMKIRNETYQKALEKCKNLRSKVIESIRD